jgi:hypothetical protein
MPSGSKRRGTSREKVRAHRKRLRSRRLRPIEFADTRSEAFAAEADRQSQVVARSRSARRDQEFIDGISLSLTGGGNESELEC